jgi:hypothetical protein
MSDHKIHDQHSHAHGSGCGRTAVKHEGHVDYLHDGHLRSAHQGHIDEHALTEGGSNPVTVRRRIHAVRTALNTRTELLADMKRSRMAADRREIRVRDCAAGRTCLFRADYHEIPDHA